jgi:hypothetical protein
MGDDPPGETVTCPFCPSGEEYRGTEGAVRAHIRGSTSGAHKGESGWGIDLDTGEADPTDRAATSTSSSTSDPDPDPDGGGDGPATDRELPAGIGRPPEPDPEEPEAACPACGEGLGYTESEIEAVAEEVREAKDVPIDEPVPVGSCEECGETIVHVHETAGEVRA